MRRLPLAAAAALLSLSGCLSGDGPPDSDAGGAMFVARLAEGLPPLAWDVAAQVDWWEDIATNYPKHDANTPTNALLRERLASDLQALGFDVEVRAYAGAAAGTDLPDVPGTHVYAVVATKPGTTMPDRRIGLVSHYDSQTLTVNGAYDDASGVAAEFAICKALASVPMERTLACIFFDGEERGLVASERYVQDVVVEADEGYGYDFVLGYDMTGINWPGHDWKLYVMCGEEHVPELYPFAGEVMHGLLGYPAEGVEVLDVHDRNSDERSFKEAGVPILRFAGGRHAADYPQYHMPLDTVPYVYQFVGGRANFEAGFATVVEASHATVLLLDRTSIGEMRAEYA